MKTIQELEQENADLRAMIERMKKQLTSALEAVAAARPSAEKRAA